ncbi:MAG: MFS transporter [Candidatus Hermodarchaeota archaeon]
MRRPVNYFLFISFIGLVVIFSSTMSKSPVLPLFAQSLMSSEAEMQYIGYVIAASTIPGILVSAIAGRLSDMYGREKLLLIATFVFATAPFFYLFATNIWALMLIRFYHGFSTAIFGPVAVAAIAETYPEQKGERISTYSSVTLIGRFFAPLTGGVILYLTNYYYYGVYLACAFSGSLGLVFALILYRSRYHLSESVHAGKKTRFTLYEFFIGLRDAIRHRIVFITSVIQASQYFAYGIIEAYIVLYAKALSYDAWIIGIMPAVLVLLLVLLKPPMGSISDKIGRRPIILVGLLLGAIAALVMPYIINPFILLLVLSIFGIGMAMVISSTAAFVSDFAKKEDIGAAIGILSTIMDIGQTIGPILSGYILVVFSYWGVFSMVGFVLILASGIFFIFVPRRI